MQRRQWAAPQIFSQALTMPSLRLRLLLVLLAILLGVWMMVAVATLYSTHHEVEELFDAHLAQSAHILLDIDEQFVGTFSHPHDIDSLASGHPYVKHLSFQLWEKGQLVLHSRYGPHQRLSDTPGFSDITLGNHNWRVYTMHLPERDIQLQVAENTHIRQELIRNISISTLLPLLAAVPFIAILVWFGLGRGIAPLHAIAQEVEKRTPHQMEPVPIAQVPMEVRPLTDAINHMLERLRLALENERRFTSDAAHELRTPLASLKVQAQVAQRAADPEARRHALQQILVGVDRSTHLVEQLLTLARLDPEAAARQHLPCDLHEIAEEVLATLATLAIQKRIDLSLHGDGPFPVQGDVIALGVMIRNLVDNAIRYTPTGGAVEVHLGRSDHEVWVSVRDSGPGIPPETWKDLFKRFRRGNHGEPFGCGLGLSIVERIAELHRAHMRMESSPLGGLNMVVAFAPLKDDAE